MSQKLICFSLAAAVFFTPLVFSLQSSSLFSAVKLTTLQIFLIFACFIWFWKMLKANRLVLIKTPLDRFILILLFWSLLSFLFSSFKFYPLKRISEIVYYCLAFYLTVNCLSQRQFQRVVIFSALAALTLVSLYGIGQYLDLVEVNWAAKQWGMDFGKRVFSTEGNPNWLGSYLILFLPAVLTLVLSGSFLTETIVFGFILFISFLCLLLTNSWAAILSIFVSLIILRFWLRGIMQERQWQKWRVTSWCMVVLLSIFLIIKGPQVLGKPNPLTTRFMHWQSALRIIKEYPCFGIGLDNFQVFSSKYESEIFKEGRFLELWQTQVPFRKTFRAHSEYLDVASELGIFALLIFLAAQIYFLKYIFQKYQRLKQNEEKFLFAGLTAGLIGICLEAMFSFPFHLVTVSFFSAIFAGMIVALGEKESEPQAISLIFKPGLAKFAQILLSVFLIFCLFFSLRPLLAAMYSAQADTLQEKGFFSLAQEKYLKAQSWQPHHPNISFRQAVAYRRSKEYSKAILSLSDSLREEPYLMQNYLNLALNYTALKDYKKTALAYEKVLSLRPRYTYAMRNLAFTYFMDKNSMQAISLMEDLINMDKQDAWSHNSLGVIYSKEAEFEKAVKEFQKALKIESTNPVFLINLQAAKEKKFDKLSDPLFDEFLVFK